MSLRRWIAEHPYATAGIAVGGLVVVGLVATSGVEAPAGAPSSAPAGWSYLSSARIWLAPGWRYRAIVSLPWYVPSAVATPTKAKAYAEDKGFTDVVVFDAQPADWPRAKGDLYVEATWSRAGQYFERPSAIEHAWVKI